MTFLGIHFRDIMSPIILPLRINILQTGSGVLIFIWRISINHSQWVFLRARYITSVSQFVGAILLGEYAKKNIGIDFFFTFLCKASYG